ncbi:DnaJ domain-containing protein [Haloarchaeobius sp. TZWWS8]|uniref:DnaJ domain-containing protein n=1 Tax=Haloarchaeobius sp. TZWWS8 TaxID=3446121 RepID=UPI003EBC25DA
MTETFYDVLGVERDASQEEIRSAYRRRVKETHPDLNDAPDAADEFRRVTDAEEVLGDPEERARYDRLGHNSYTRMFGRAGDGSASRERSRPGESEAASRSSGSRGRTRSRRRRTNRRRTDGRQNGRRQTNRRQSSDRRTSRGAGADRRATDSGNASRRSYSFDSASHEEEPTDRRSADASDGASARRGDRGRSESRARRETRGRYEHVAEGKANEWQGFSVHDWDEEELATDPEPIGLTQNTAVVVGSIFLLYPVLAYATVAPGFGLAVNVTVGACTLLLLGYLLTIPRVSTVGFGALSLVVPVLLFAAGVNLFSLMNLFVVGACWVPFGYAILFSRVLSSPT